MKHALAALVLAIAGCNTAQLTQPPQTDSGSAICAFAPSFADCDGGSAPEAGAPCGAEPDAGIQSAAYPVGCQATTHHYDPAGDCAIQYICTCSPNSDGGGSYWACAE
jgi:hypothetical protein